MKFQLSILVILLLAVSVLGVQKQTTQKSYVDMVREMKQNKKVTEFREEDENTVSNYNKCNVEKYTLDLEIDFEAEILKGEVHIYIEALQDLDEVHLDAWHLDVSRVSFETYDEDEDLIKPVFLQQLQDWEDDLELDHVMGGSIFINVDKLVNVKQEDGSYELGKIPTGAKFKLIIEYETLPAQVGNESGFSFVKLEHTHGQSTPYFYTQNMPIYARTWFPCFDTPHMASEIDLNIKTPNTVKLWSTCDEELVETHNPDNTILWTQYQEVPKVRTYQIALVAAMLEERIIEDGIVLIGDGEIIDAAYEKLKNVHKWINTVQGLVDVPFGYKNMKFVIMPPNYPFEGAQHGTLTYVSPTLLYDGKAGESFVFHEIANNYFGGIVSCANWRNLWINEGIATYIERETQDWYLAGMYSGIDRIVGNFTFVEDLEMIDQFRWDESFKSLHPYTKLKNPDDAITKVPFEKGYQLMIFIEQLYESRTKVFSFLKHFLLKHLDTHVDYEDFWETLSEFTVSEFGQEDGEAILSKIDYPAWIDGIGLPPKDTIEDFTSEEYDVAAELANKFIQFNGSARPQNYLDVLNSPLWNNDMRYAFIDYFNKKAYMINARIIKQLDEYYDFKNHEDFDIRSRWFTLTNLHKYSDIENTNLMHEFLGKTGRISQVVPVYEAMALVGQQDKAGALLKTHLEFYHPQTTIAVENAVFHATM